MPEDYTGSTDLPLTSKGLIQVAKMSARAQKEFPPEFIWSSTLKRASQAAGILADAVGCPVAYLDDLRERQETESIREFRARAERILSSIEENSKAYKRIAIVSHGGMITKLIESFLPLPHENNVCFHSDNTGIHLLEQTPKWKIIRFANSTAHLNGDEPAANG
ncbi:MULTISPECIES: histidine phosphatase family protein [Brevibacillus]|uniref:histidine phosphatase family protein n=1 Tax=Brevibacillus TaxID=55080 RepID=UPI0009D9A496|nr:MULTISPECIES: histidine phosphatase family protein [Brevibacillus]MBY0054697.1 histidine phosphatase family protein [Brevibacillus agri]MED3500408.1 histidine phosphatase family protein [Brevibacillus agri]WHX32525.1 histidine phosphatase family protein [Brevibacillus agri]